VLFVAGDVDRLASIKIRCREIARRLDMACYFNAADPQAVPAGYKAYLCVKPDFGREGALRLAQRAPVIWDILDNKPPLEGMLAYLASTHTAAGHFRHLNRVAVIPHYHCNIERQPACGDAHQVGFVGSAHWYPDLGTVPHRSYLVDGWNREQVAAAYRSIGVALNLRNVSNRYDHFLRSPADIRPDLDLHLKINSGMKLINCLGFGLPSISAPEPAYHEIAPHCTVFSDLPDCSAALARLHADDVLYRELRRRCLEIAPAFHVDEIVAKYRDFIARL